MLLLCALVVGSASVWAATTYKLTQVSSVEAGSLYVFEQAGHVMNNSVSSSALQTTDTYKTSGLAGTETYVWTLETANGGFYLKNVSLKSNQYLNNASSTTVSLGNKNSIWSIEFTDGIALISNTKNSNRFLGYISSTSYAYKAYAVSNLDSYNHAIKVYLLEEEDAGLPSSSVTFSNATPSITLPGTTVYSQVATTADGYDNSLVEYSITANTAGATIVGSNVTVLHEGSVTVKATAPAVDGSFAKSEATYTLTVTDGRTDAGLSWSSATADVTYNQSGTYSLPSLTNTHSLAVTYTSSNEDIATIDADGVLTIKNVTGSTNITATFAGNEDYKAQSVSYTLNVTKVFVIEDGVFDFVGAGSHSVDYGSGEELTSDGNYYNTEETTWTAGNVTMVVSGKYRWWKNSKELRLYNNNPLSAATFSVPDGYVITKIVTTGGNFASASAGDLSNDVWTGFAQSVKLSIYVSTVNFKTITVTYMAATYTRPVTADKWGTLCLPYDATVTGATLYTFEGVDDIDAPTVAYFEEAASVEAGKPYFFKATGETLTATYTSGVAQEAGSAKGAVGTLEDMDVAEGKYLLSNNELVKCGTGCTLAANRVYVDMSEASVYSGGGAVKMGVDLTDGISVVDAQSANATAFDLSGRRVVKPTKGLYIVNGKKVVIK